MDTNFKVGERVRITGRALRRGQDGTVTAVGSSAHAYNVAVRVDGTDADAAYRPDELERIEDDRAEAA